ncbi:MAG: hypothetical protein ABIU05_24960 [Nitrospirales bacterium]
MKTFTLQHLGLFFDVCNEAHEVWILRRTLIDDNLQIDDLRRGHYVHLLERLSRILHEYLLLQLGKLHDPAHDHKRDNLSISYIVKYGAWDKATGETLRTLARELDSLDKQIRPARHRIIAHNDEETMVKGVPLGKFPPGADTKYFQALHEFLRLAYEKMTGDPCGDFSSGSRTDARFLIRVFLESNAMWRGRTSR